MGGWEPGITLIAGRPSSGKTTLEDCAGTFLASRGVGVLRVSLDSSREELLDRAVARKAGVSLPKLKFGWAKMNQLAAVDEAGPILGDYPMWINTRDQDIRMICAWIRSMCARHKIGLVTLDYVRLIGASEMGRQEYEATPRVSLVSGRLKKLSLELGIPFLLLVQLNREFDKASRDPKLSDLSDSGSLEQDASKVIFVYQNSKKHKEMELGKRGATRNVRPVFFDVAKHKNGRTGRLAKWMLAPYFTFEDAEAEHDGDVPLQKWKHLTEIGDELRGFAVEESDEC
jgi:replicative DNA helicase